MEVAACGAPLIRALALLSPASGTRRETVAQARKLEAGKEALEKLKSDPRAAAIAMVPGGGPGLLEESDRPRTWAARRRGRAGGGTSAGRISGKSRGSKSDAHAAVASLRKVVRVLGRWESRRLDAALESRRGPSDEEYAAVARRIAERVATAARGFGSRAEPPPEKLADGASQPRLAPRMRKSRADGGRGRATRGGSRAAKDVAKIREDAERARDTAAKNRSDVRSTAPSGGIRDRGVEEEGEEDELPEPEATCQFQPIGSHAHPSAAVKTDRCEATDHETEDAPAQAAKAAEIARALGSGTSLGGPDRPQDPQGGGDAGHGGKENVGHRPARRSENGLPLAIARRSTARTQGPDSRWY